MKLHRVVFHLFALALALNPILAQQAAKAPEKQEVAKAPRPLEFKDALGWKRVSSPTISNDGQWFAHKLVPNEGDSEVVLRRNKDGKEWRFPTGESQGFGGPPGLSFGASDVAFSDDGKWFAFSVSPTFKDGKRLRKERKPLQNKVTVIELETEKKVEIEKVRRFAFSGENSAWIALHKYGADAGPAMPPAAAGAAPGGATPPERATGSDLILRELASGNELNVGNVADFAFDKKGSWLAWTIDANEKSGNGIQVRNMSNGAVLPLDSDKAIYRGLNWTEKGEGLAAVKGVEDKGFEDKLYSVVAFNFTSGSPQKVTFNPKDDKDFPAGLTISPNRSPSWTEDMSAVMFGLHEVKRKKPGATPPTKEGEEQAAPNPAAMMARRNQDEPEKPDLVLWHWQDKRLQSQQQVEEPRDKNFSYLATYRVAEKKFIRLADEALRTVNAAPKQQYGIGLDTREYEMMGNLDGRRYQDVYVVDLKTGARKLALKKNRNAFGASPDGTQMLYFEDGHFFTYDLASNQSTNITAKIPTSFWDTEDDHNVVKPPIFPLGWTKDSKFVLLTDDWDIWQVPAKGGNAINLTVNGKKDKIRYQTRFRLDPEEKGIDLTQPMYLRAYGEWTKKAGIARLEAGKPGTKMLMWDDASYGALMKAKKADSYLYSRDTFDESPTYFLADASLANGQKLTNANPQQKDFFWSSGSKLVDYTSAKGDKLQGALYLPANYQPGKSYPTIVYIYEKRSQGLNGYVAPTFSGFNKSLYTSNGYAVFEPDITYKINDPGMSAVWCILPGLQAAIATGVVDKDKVALHGHSWGGYQTAFMVTQSDAFKAAIAGAPLTDMISMYNLVYWNSGGGNMAIFESSQGRFTTSPVDNPEAYIRNSPVFHAKNVKTPLIILHNDKDGAVDFTQGIEYFNQLRRLQKPVVMLQYKGENHGLRVPANMRDYAVRMKEFFDHHLMGKPAPQWWKDGVPHLKLKEHLEERAKPEPDVTPLNNGQN
ncbi:MAG: S9 family peptidase [Blastocatellia bacterium]|nr:S9 family peptidase [Blastocatellia bacterium]